MEELVKIDGGHTLTPRVSHDEVGADFTLIYLNLLFHAINQIGAALGPREQVLACYIYG